MKWLNIFLNLFYLFLLSITLIACDPTEQARGIYLRNDFSSPVELEICGDENCKTLAPTDYHATLPPGGELPVNVSIYNVPTTYKVSEKGSISYRCLVLVLDKEPPKLKIILVSTSRVCEK